jgi:hypothetical protein
LLLFDPKSVLISDEENRERRMADVLTSEDRLGTAESEVSAISWAAILAGGLASAALSLLLLAFGTGMGFSVVSPWANSGVTSTTFSLWAGLYLIVIAMIASSIGGYLAGRLRTKWVGVHTHEVYFRDTAHGFLAWAFSTVLSAAVLTAAASQIVGVASSGLVQSAGSGAVQSAGLLDDYVDMLLRTDPAANRNSGDLPRNEVARLMNSSLRGGGDLNATDRSYLSQLIAARTGLSTADADKRVTDVVAQAKVAVDTTRKAAAHLALWLTASLLIGAFCASLAATEGGGLRDGTWNSGLRHVRTINQI